MRCETRPELYRDEGFFITIGSKMELTGVDGSHRTLNNDGRQTFKPR